MPVTVNLVHRGTERIETPRLLLRKSEQKDLIPMFDNWVNDPQVTRFLTWKQHGNIKVTEKVLSDWIMHYPEPDFYQWAIVPKDNGDMPIGTISVVGKNDDIGLVHIGYCIGRRWWRQGYTSEALSALIEFFFERVGMNRIESRHDPNNPNSGRVMRKCGMKYEGTARQADRNNQGICDYSLYAILAEEYFAAKEDAAK